MAWRCLGRRGGHGIEMDIENRSDLDAFFVDPAAFLPLSSHCKFLDGVVDGDRNTAVMLTIKGRLINTVVDVITDCSWRLIPLPYGWIPQENMNRHSTFCCLEAALMSMPLTSRGFRLLAWRRRGDNSTRATHS